MVQQIAIGALKGVGIVAVLVILGIILKTSNVSPGAGNVAISGGLFIGISLGLLGIVGVLKRMGAF